MAAPTSFNDRLARGKDALNQAAWICLGGIQRQIRHLRSQGRCEADQFRRDPPGHCSPQCRIRECRSKCLIERCVWCTALSIALALKPPAARNFRQGVQRAHERRLAYSGFPRNQEHVRRIGVRFGRGSLPYGACLGELAVSTHQAAAHEAIQGSAVHEVFCLGEAPRTTPFAALLAELPSEHERGLGAWQNSLFVLADLFDALPSDQAQREFNRELAKLRNLCLGLLGQKRSAA